MRRNLLIVFLMTITMSVCGVTVAQPVPSTQPSIQPSEQAIGKIHDMGKYLKAVKSFRMFMVSTFDLQAEKEPIVTTSKFNVACRRPDDMAVVFTEGDTTHSIYSTKQAMVVHIEDQNKYMKMTATPISELADSPVMQLGGPEAVLSQILSDSPVMALLNGAYGIELVGEQEIDGVNCHRLKVMTQSHSWYLWIETGDTPLPRKIEYDFTEQYRQMLAGKDTIESAIVTLLMSRWEVDVEVGDEVFVFTPGEGVEEVADPLTPPNPMDLLDQPAPDYSLELLGGGMIDPVKEKGKVVVLDFWASYCPPCIAGMPILQKLTKKYTGQDVSIYAINVGESEQTVKGVISMLNVNLNVAIDNEDNISGRFKVYGIPQTVVIDREGIVRKVHVGGIPNLEMQLTHDIEAVRGME